MDVFGQSEDVRKFLTAIDEGKKPKKYDKFIKNHKFKNMDKGTRLDHYFLIINIPESKKEYFKGRTSPVPRFGRLHKTVRGYGKWAERKDFLNLFPHSKVGDIRCTGDDSCLVCQRIAEYFEKMGIEKIDKKWTVPNNCSHNEKEQAKGVIQTVDGSLKGKQKVIFNAIVFTRDPDNQKLWNKKFERFVMSKFYWDRDFRKVLFESRNEDSDTWIKEDHWDDVFTYNDEEKPLSDFSKSERHEIFLKNTKSIYPIPWHMMDGKMLHYEEVDGVDTPGVLKFKKDQPYFPPAFMEVEGLDAKVQVEMKKKLDKSTDLYNWVIENIDDMTDIDKYFPESITAEQQREILQIDKETIEKNITGEVKTEEKVENIFDKEEEAADDPVGDIGEGLKKENTDNTLTPLEDEDFPF